jgi:hypothetical protein
MHHPDERVSVLYHYVLDRCVGWVGELASMSVNRLGTLNNPAQHVGTLQIQVLRSYVNISTHMYRSTYASHW